MKRNGNTNSNRTYNPQNTKPAIPLDVDEVDGALERFIRQKYDQQLFSGGSTRTAKRQDTGSTRSSDEQPPPLPPKPGKRFGFGLRSVSSAFTLPKPPPESPPRSPGGQSRYHTPPPPIRVNKQSRVFGASVGGGGEDLESKLATLRDMGFSDEKRNVHVLKGLSGNLERAIESLVRLGEGSAPISREKSPRNIAVSQPLPATRKQSGFAPGVPAATNGIAAPAQTGYRLSRPQQATTQNFPPSSQFPPESNNPFESAQPQSATDHLDKAFQNIQLSQPLFPNATGGYPSQHQPLQEARLQQSMTPPVPQIPYQNFQSNPYAQSAQTGPTNYNPFYSAPQVSSTPASPHTNNFQQQTSATSYNPFAPSPSVGQIFPASQFANGQPSQFSTSYSLPQLQQNQPAFNQFASLSQNLSQPNPYLLQQSPISNPTTSAQTFQPANYFPPQPLQPQPTGRIDKSSILALYNYPQLAPSPQYSGIDGNHTLQSPAAIKNDPLPSLPEGAALRSTQQRSVTMPVQPSSGSRNPFHSSAPTTSAAVPPQPVNGMGTNRHVSQESVDIAVFQSGRHSPDAFASLSARSVR